MKISSVGFVTLGLVGTLLVISLLIIGGSLYIKSQLRSQIKNSSKMSFSSSSTPISTPFISFSSASPNASPVVDNIFPDEQDNMSKIDEYYNSLDDSCKVDSDCSIKNVGNGCGYYPDCVNKDAQTNPDIFKKYSVIGVCGFPVIKKCECKSNKCENALN